MQRLQPAIVLMDLALPGRDGIAVIAALRAAHTASAVVILNWQDDATIRARAQAAGAAAFVGKHEGVYPHSVARLAAAQGKQTASAGSQTIPLPYLSYPVFERRLIL